MLRNFSFNGLCVTESRGATETETAGKLREEEAQCPLCEHGEECVGSKAQVSLEEIIVALPISGVGSRYVNKTPNGKGGTGHETNM